MRRRARAHAVAAVLLGGLILLEPPVKADGDGKWSVDTSRPLSEWSRISAYDAADACNQARADRVANAPGDLGESAEREKAGSKLGAAWDARTKSRCVADAEIYPREKPVPEPE